MAQIQLQAQTYRVVVDRYSNGNVALYLLNLHDDRLVTSCTVDVPGYELLQGECLIKADAENAGILEALVDAGIVKPLGLRVPYTRSGTIAHLCQVINTQEQHNLSLSCALPPSKDYNNAQAVIQ